MSIVAQMQDAAEARKPTTQRTRGLLRAHQGRAATPDKPSSSLATVASELTRYIPTEAVATYTAILPFLVSDSSPLSEQNYTGRWILAGAVAVAAVLFAVGVYKSEIEARGKKFRWPPKRTGVVLFAFVGWVFVIPGSPFASFGWYTPSIGAIGGIAANTVLALVTLWFGQPEEP
jgi:hypothetical protein